MCFVRLIKRVVCIWWCNQNGQHMVRTNGWAMHEATCLKTVHVTSDIKEHVTQWSIWDEKIWPISWGSWIHVIWWPIVRFLDRYINWLGPLRGKCIRWVLLDRSPYFFVPHNSRLRPFWLDHGGRGGYAHTGAPGTGMTQPSTHCPTTGHGWCHPRTVLSDFTVGRFATHVPTSQKMSQFEICGSLIY